MKTLSSALRSRLRRSVLVLATVALSSPAFAIVGPGQDITVNLMWVMVRGPNLNNAQHAHITIDGKRSDRIVLRAACPSSGCANVNPETCNTPGNKPMQQILRDFPARYTVPVGQCGAPVRARIEVWYQFFAGDDTLVVDHNFDIDRTSDSGRLCSFQREPGGNEGGVLFGVTVDQDARRDSDGDGLLDAWETHGFDANCDGELRRGDDVYLHEMGVSPTHKDLLMQADWYVDPSPGARSWTPTIATFRDIREAFANAPIDAGGIANPDGLPGINVIIDAGTHVDPATGLRLGDPLNDLDLLGGRNLGDPNGGPGNPPAPTGEDDLAALVAQRLQVRGREGIFRHFVFGPTWAPDLGGIAPGFGDVVYLGRLDGLAAMHELGHSMGLRHGGFEDHNCKPNHASIMNYSYADRGGIPWADGTIANGALQWLVDFGPSQVRRPALAANARLPVLGALLERSLSEEELVPETQQQAGRQRVIFNGPGNIQSFGRVSRFSDWNDSGARDAQRVAVDIDWDQDVADCAVNEGLGGYEAYDEWHNVRIAPNSVPGGNLLQLGELKAEPLPTPEQVVENRARLLETDLRLGVETSADFATVGERLRLEALVTNEGVRTANAAGVRITLPPGVHFVSVPSGCDVSGETMTCHFGDQRRGQGNTTAVDIIVDANTTGGARRIGIQAFHNGRDTRPSDNTFSVPVVSNPAFASIEDSSRPWVKAWTTPAERIPVSPNASQGRNSLAIGCGYTNLESPTFDTAEWELLGNQLEFDVFVPSGQTNPSWVGDIGVSFDLPSANIHNQWLANVPLTSLSRGSWQTVRVAVPTNVRSALRGDHPDGRIRLGINVASCTSPVLLDHFRFGGATEVRTNYHEVSGGNTSVLSFGALTFDAVSAWSSAQTTLAPSSLRSRGAAALSVAPTSWWVLESALLPAAPLANATRTFAVDVFVPELPADPYWVGDLQLYFECPSVGLFNHYVDQQRIYPSFDGEFNALRFTLSESVAELLRTSPADCRVRFALSANPSYGTFLLDNAGFVAP